MIIALFCAGSCLLPPPRTPMLEARGQAVYDDNCMTCHGSSGEGNGPAGKYLVPKPRNFKKDKFVFGDSVSDIFTTITNGYNQMPSFGGLSENDRWAVSYYVKNLRDGK